VTDRDLLERIAVACEKLVSIAERRQQSRPASGNGPAIASDRDLDGPHGDPEVRFDPRDWTGVSCKGRRFSACPAAFLDVLAGVLDAFADGESDPKKAKYKRLDAARARGWARRNEGKDLTPSRGAGGGGTAQATDDGWGDSEARW
jgi:hypothetical protein